MPVKMLRKHPHLYEINLMPWLADLSEKDQKNYTLATIPDGVWLGFKKKGFDLIWLMGVWHRSQDSRRRARKNPHLIKKCQSIFTNFSVEDIKGSPYSIDRYVPDPVFGTEGDLLALKKKLEEMGLGLILDFVPNHTACDHAWITEKPQYYVRRIKPETAGRCPNGFFRAKETPGKPCIAHGRDPFFHPWEDTAQLDYTNPAAVNAMSDLLQGLSGNCHGFRCDMTMLVLKQVFQKTWLPYLDNTGKAGEFWRVALEQLRSSELRPIMIAEVYWGMQQTLIDLGFDYAYDKTFYDFLLRGDVPGLKTHLSLPAKEQAKRVRFLENHDEVRAMEVFGPERIYCAMVIHATLPGMRLWNHGQFEGRRVKMPVHIRRMPSEPACHEIEFFSDALLQETNHPVFHQGEWSLCKTQGWRDNSSHENLLVWCWRLGRERRLIVANFAETASQGLVQLPQNWLPESDRFLCHDPIKKDRYVRNTLHVKTSGLHVELNPWGRHFFNIMTI